jgi:hypothetical protein
MGLGWVGGTKHCAQLAGVSMWCDLSHPTLNIPTASKETPPPPPLPPGRTALSPPKQAPFHFFSLCPPPVSHISSTPRLPPSCVQEVAAATGVVLDPVYSGKALAGLLADMAAAPGEWAGQDVLFIHTGGLLVRCSGEGEGGGRDQDQARACCCQAPGTL